MPTTLKRLIVALTLLLASTAHADVWRTLTDDKLFENPNENRISFIFYRAPKKIDWSSPGAMVRTAIWNTLSGDRNPLSHVDAVVSCVGERSVATGMSSKKDWGLYKSILLGQKSLDLLIQEYPGYLITDEEIRKEAPRYAEKDRVRTLSFKVSAAACKRTLDYIAEYRKRDYAKIYAGFAANPFKGEGAGCAAFSISVLKVAGLFDNEFLQKWTHRLQVPKQLINTATARAKANFWDFMLFGMNGVWGKKGDAESLSLLAFDPERMYDWVASVSRAPQAWDATARAVKHGVSLGIEVDRSQARAPTDDYWSYVFPPRNY